MGIREGTEEFPASLFPGLCEGLIKYGWCLDQSRGKWDSTNSTCSRCRQPHPAVMELGVVFCFICLSVLLLP